VSLPPSGQKNKPSKKPAETGGKIGFFLDFFDPEDGSNMFLRNVGGLLPTYTSLQPHNIEIVIFTVLRTSNPGLQ
jgi:hypothetical protein